MVAGRYIQNPAARICLLGDFLEDDWRPGVCLLDGQYPIRDGSGLIGKRPDWRYVLTDDSDTIVGTDGETSYGPNITLDSNRLQVGSTIGWKLSGEVEGHTDHTVTWRIKTIVEGVQTTLFVLEDFELLASQTFWSFDFFTTVREVGASGSAHTVIRPSYYAGSLLDGSEPQVADLDTTVPNSFLITAQFSDEGLGGGFGGDSTVMTSLELEAKDLR